MSDLKINEAKIKEIGRAIIDKSELILQCYLTSSEPPVINKSLKQTRLLIDSGVIRVGSQTMTLGSGFKDILRRLDQRSYRTHTMPDIEDFKENMRQSIERAKCAAFDCNDFNEEANHLANIQDEALMLSEAMAYEMANIEYIINSELNSTTSIKAKRIILDGLSKKIKSQIQKISALSREELHELHGDYIGAAIILDEHLSGAIDKFTHEMAIHLEKTLSLIDVIENSRTQKDRLLWQLHKALRNGQLEQSMFDFSFDDLEAMGLAFGGNKASQVLTHINLKNEAEINHTLALKLAKTQPNEVIKKTQTVYQGEVVNPKSVKVEPLNDDKDQLQIKSKKLWALDYLKHNNIDDWSQALSVSDYWQFSGIDEHISYKSFLALVLRICNSNFRDDHVFNKKQDVYWKLFLKHHQEKDFIDTVYVVDAKYLRCRANLSEPSKDQLWL